MRILTSFVALVTLTATAVPVIAMPNLNTASPIVFFTNVASRALSQELNLDLMQIQIYPTNQYTPAVHRLLQVAANVCDATTTNLYPSVFRPVFTNDGTNVFISGYEQVVSVTDTTDSQLALPADAASLPIGISTNVNIYGVPWIIGVKKGFPNFNEFSMENIVGIERRLEITRPSTNAQLSQYQTNQIYMLGISNSIGVECWNSYSTNYIPASGNLSITVRDALSVTLTNDNGMTPLISSAFIPNTVNLSNWPGTSQPWINNDYNPNSNSFDVPLNTTIFLLTNEAYVYSDHQFETLTNYVDSGVVPLPQFGLMMTNRLQVFMLDGTNVIDYVQFSGPESDANLNSLIADFDPNHPNAGFWNTNLSNSGMPDGVIDQILYSENPQLNGGSFIVTANDNRTWVNLPGGTVGQKIASFNAFFSPNHVGTGTDPNTGVSYKSTNLNLSVVVPFTPIRTIYGYISWQANDPLVHYLASDLNYSGSEPSGLETGWHQWNSSTTNIPANNLGFLNDRYQPWGINTQMRGIAGVDTNALNLAFKDPLVDSSDDWDFPDGQMTNLDWIRAFALAHRLHGDTGVETYRQPLPHESCRCAALAVGLALFHSVRAGKVRVLFGSTQKMGSGTNVQERLIALHHLDAPWRPADVEQREGRILRQGNKNSTVQIYRYVTEGSFDAYMWQTLETKAKFISQVMSGDMTIRRLEDMDSAALTYAEIKAIASGNPLVIEKAQVDAELIRLTRLRSAHAEEQYRIRASLRHSREEVQAWTERLGNLREDLTLRQDTSGDKFRVELDKQTLDNRGIAGELLLRRAEKIKGRFGEDIRIGRFAGFDLSVRAGFNNTAELILRGKNSYSTRITDTALGTIRSLESVVQGFEERAARMESDIKDSQKRVTELEAKVGSPFEKEERYHKLVNRQSEIEEKLDLTKNQAPNQLDTGSADETEEKNSEVQNTAKTIRSQTKTTVKV